MHFLDIYIPDFHGFNGIPVYFCGKKAVCIQFGFKTVYFQQKSLNYIQNGFLNLMYRKRLPCAF